MFTKYKGVQIPQNYSGSRFKADGLETEMKTHKPTPSYSSTRTSVSPTFQSAIDNRYDRENQKIGGYVYENEGKEDYYNEENEVEGLAEENENTGDEACQNKTENKKGAGAFIDEIKPFFNKLITAISNEDLLLLGLILLLASEDSDEARGAILALFLLFLYP